MATKRTKANKWESISPRPRHTDIKLITGPDDPDWDKAQTYWEQYVRHQDIRSKPFTQKSGEEDFLAWWKFMNNITGTQIRTHKGRLRAVELMNNQERIREIFLILAGQTEQSVAKTAARKDPSTSPCWVWQGTCSLPYGVPQFGQAHYYSGGKAGGSARKYAFIEFRGLEDHLSDRVYQFYSCADGCVNPWHALQGQRSAARQR